MFLARSDQRQPGTPDSAIASALAQVSEQRLRAYVEALSFPRHYLAERAANVRARNLLFDVLRGFGYAPRLQGQYDNVVTSPNGRGPFVLLGAHYDSVPGTPGSDDNASAVAAALECARVARLAGVEVVVALFNREEDGMLGSREFVAELVAQDEVKVREAHVFEMVGYCSHEAKSQRLPAGLPIGLARDVGDFLALLANRHSNDVAEEVLTLSATYLPELPVAALKAYLGIERLFGDLLRSDHAPFWDAKLPALMWTDTSEFRNPHYHRASDTPDTLDYAFLARVTRLALARAMTASR